LPFSIYSFCLTVNSGCSSSSHCMGSLASRQKNKTRAFP
jgi:hypothetical protein